MDKLDWWKRGILIINNIVHGMDGVDIIDYRFQNIAWTEYVSVSHKSNQLSKIFSNASILILLKDVSRVLVKQNFKIFFK